MGFRVREMGRRAARAMGRLPTRADRKNLLLLMSETAQI
jgi:hypothetical protein